jgi:Myb-like DNA-binding domain
MTGAALRQSNWTPEEDRRLLEFVEAGKSWVLISANLKRSLKSVQDRAQQLEAKDAKAK